MVKRTKGQQLRKILQVQDITYEPHYTYPRLKDLLQRANRGWTPYTNCSVTELFSFVRARSLRARWPNSGENMEYVRERLIARRKYADDHARLERFMELPSELRTMVYGSAMLQTRDPRRSTRRLQPRKQALIDPVNWGQWELHTTVGWQHARRTLALAQTSSLVREEALPVFYAVHHVRGGHRTWWVRWGPVPLAVRNARTPECG